MTNKLFEEALQTVPESVRLLVEYQHAIAERLATELASQGITQREFAERAGKDESYISEVLAASKNLTLRTISELSSALRIDLLGFVHKSSIIRDTTTSAAADNMQNFILKKDNTGIIIGVTPVHVELITENRQYAGKFA